MPRRPRDDLQPLIRIPEHPLQRGARERFGDDLSFNDEVIIRERKRIFRPEDKFITINDDVLESFEHAAESVNRFDPSFASFNYRIFFKLWKFVPLSHCLPQSMRDSTSGAFIRDLNENGVLNRMVDVGCRVMHTGIGGLATAIGVSTSTLEKQLSLYREIELIVNEANAIRKRKGFIEFDALVGWRGKSEHREAYLLIQGVSN